MKSSLIICGCIFLTACSQHYTEDIDRAYVKDCNDRGGKIERIEYSDQLQCVGATNKDTSK